MQLNCDFEPGTLVIANDRFFIVHGININHAKKTWSFDSSLNRGPTRPLVKAGSSGVVVSSPCLKRHGFLSDSRVLYVVFPEAIGWVTISWIKEVDT